MSIDIKIDFEGCKGCYLCIWACPKKEPDNVLAISKKSNNKSYFPVVVDNKNKENCTACGNCYIMCPEARKLSYMILAGTGFGVAGWNWSQIEKQKEYRVLIGSKYQPVKI